MKNRKQKFIKIIQNEPLLITRANSKLIKKDCLFKKGGSIFFGVGLMTRQQLSEFVPFDILAMFFMCELLKNKLNLEKVNVLLADSHAISNNIHSAADILRTTLQTKRVLEKIIRNFALEGFEIIQASQVHANKSFKQVLNSLPNIDNQYLKFEIADTIWLQQTQDLRIKIGWALEKRLKVQGNDERFFDMEIKKFCKKISLVHLSPGKTFDINRPRVSPYLSIHGENRIVLVRGENVDLKIRLASNSQGGILPSGAIKHLSLVVRLFEKLRGRLPLKTMTDKIQFLVDKATL